MEKKIRKKRKKKPKTLKSFLIPVLRSASLRWPARQECLKNARISRGVYQCNKCKKKCKKAELVIDHIEPVVNIKESWQGWDVYIESLFCGVDNLQAICRPCHDIKSSYEQELRKEYKNKS